MNKVIFLRTVFLNLNSAVDYSDIISVCYQQKGKQENREKRTEKRDGRVSISEYLMAAA